MICCEGRETEPGYFTYLRIKLRNELIEIRVIGVGLDPSQLVKSAITRLEQSRAQARREHDQNLLYDQVWCVLDTDEHARIEQARVLAARSGVRLAVSNPSFELWPLLHHENQRAYITGPQVVERWRQIQSGYHKKLACQLLDGRYEDARARAIGLDQMHNENRSQDRNPSTAVWQLTDSLFADRSARP